MKCLTLFVHAALQSEVVDTLRELPEVTGFTLTECQGHSSSTGTEPFQATRDLVVGFVPRVRIDLVLEAGAVETVLGRLRASGRKEGALGAWSVSEVEDFGRL